MKTGGSQQGRGSQIGLLHNSAFAAMAAASRDYHKSGGVADDVAGWLFGISHLFVGAFGTKGNADHLAKPVNNAYQTAHNHQEQHPRVDSANVAERSEPIENPIQLGVGQRHRTQGKRHGPKSAMEAEVAVKRPLEAVGFRCVVHKLRVGLFAERGHLRQNREERKHREEVAKGNQHHGKERRHYQYG